MQPLSRVHPTATAHFKQFDLSIRPKIAEGIAQCITAWTEVELQMGHLLAILLETTASTAMSMYLSVDAASAQAAILTAAAESVMTEDEFEVFAALMTTVRAAHKHRNKFAHWHWGYSDEITDGLLLIEPKYRLRHTSEWWSRYMRTGRFDEDDRLYDREQIMVVKPDDLARSLREIRGAVRLLRLLHRVFLVKNAGDPAVRETSAELLRQLSDEPPIREALLRSRARQ
jgi:hypothetical protein